jgi:hypothetical protein
MRYACILLAWLWLPLGGMAQTYEDLSPYEVEMRVLQFYDELDELFLRSSQKLDFDYESPMPEGLVQSVDENINSMEGDLQSFNTRWNTYQQGVQSYIASDDTLLVKVADVQQLQQKVTESIASLRQQFDQMEAFNRAEVYLFSQDSTYSSLYSQAMKLTLSAKLQAQLEKVKASEQLQFANVQKSYEEAKQTAEAIPQLKDRMQRLENKYVELKVVSGKIQEAVYKPLMERIKDWLMSTAAVAIVLMFANMVIARIKAARKAVAQAKKLKDMMGGAQDYPTI